MSIIAQSRRPAFTNFRLAIWSSFLLVVVAPVIFERLGYPYWGAVLLRPGYWILARVNPAMASDRVVVLVNFAAYLLVIYLVLRLFRKKRAQPAGLGSSENA